MNVFQNTYRPAHPSSPLTETFFVLFFALFSPHIALKIKIEQNIDLGWSMDFFMLLSNSNFIKVIENENKITSLKNARETQRIKLHEINIPILILQQTYFIPNLSNFLDHTISELHFLVFSFYFHGSPVTVLCSQMRMLKFSQVTAEVAGARVFISWGLHIKVFP